LGLTFDGGEDLEDVAEDTNGRLGGVDGMDDGLGIELEDVAGFAFVGLEPALDDLDVGVVEPVFLEGATLDAGDEFTVVRAAQVQDHEDIEGFGKDLGLLPVARDAVQDEEILIGLELAGLGVGADVVVPELDGKLVGDELSLAGVLEEGASEFGFRAEAAEDITAGTVIVTGDGAEDFALGTFAGARSAEEEDGLITHEGW
jgi:hypothetical protein